MRIEQIIAAVTRLVISQVREIRGVETFVASCLHSLWQMWMPLGMSCYSGANLSSGGLLGDSSPISDAGSGHPKPGMKLGNLLGQLRLATTSSVATAGYPAGTSAA